MQLANIDLGKLSVSTLNMRHGKTAPDVSDILPSIRARGVLVPLLVRPSGEDETFEIVAGRRRYFASRTLLEESGEVDPLPCAIMEPGDDAAALEASLIENLARLDPDAVTQWETFTRLVKQGRTIEDIGRTFGLTDLYVRRILALGNLQPRIRALYAADKIDARTVRCLTLASKTQQKDWLALHDDPEQYAPTGASLKAWLFGGQSIPTKVALFDLDAYPGRIKTDLFGEDGYFEDADLFWTCQNEAVAALRDRYLEDGWTAVEVMDVGDYFHGYEYEKTPKAKGGKVFIAVSARGEVTIHEGYLSGKEARKARAAAAKAEAEASGQSVAAFGKPEVTSTMQTYLDLHRHAAVRAVLTDHPGVALRLMVAHAIAGSSLWSVKVEGPSVRNEAVAESVETCPAETAFDAKRRAVLALLGFGPDDPTVARGGFGETPTVEVFARLIPLPDDAVMAVAAVVMGETLAAGGPLVEAVGAYLKVDMGQWWTPDPVFFDLIRDRPVANALLKDVGGKRVADANVSDKVKTQKAIVRDFLDGTNDRPKVERWTPKWLAFPPARYTDRVFPPVERWAGVKAVVRRLPPPEAPAPQPYVLAAE
ncbi:ParB N-terminal domain-containing protein [Brevundimonas sp. SORGH_AS_0993]|uniref:ParB/RepB/Spo0J family partition protein n=1 Tax=Brevundimonas sp. SORGH_AS_0993 TaxID=3041794 RepID=UPI002785E6E3|nr:ParB N-terminal domain-containing protein [Brevundimonas sp. SORGH_AS_0993]MDQ1153431.1 ParB family chromosome partitioning protein [Brevundimonas sp. SORGH_AS_0993]